MKSYEHQLYTLEEWLLKGWSINVSLRRAGISQLQYSALLKEDPRVRQLIDRFRKRGTTKAGETYERVIHASVLLPPEPTPPPIFIDYEILPRGINAKD